MYTYIKCAEITNRLMNAKSNSAKSNDTEVIEQYIKEKIKVSKRIGKIRIDENASKICFNGSAMQGFNQDTANLILQTFFKIISNPVNDLNYWKELKIKNIVIHDSTLECIKNYINTLQYAALTTKIYMHKVTSLSPEQFASFLATLHSISPVHIAMHEPSDVHLKKLKLVLQETGVSTYPKGIIEKWIMKAHQEMMVGICIKHDLLSESRVFFAFSYAQIHLLSELDDIDGYEYRIIDKIGGYANAVGAGNPIGIPNSNAPSHEIQSISEAGPSNPPPAKQLLQRGMFSKTIAGQLTQIQQSIAILSARTAVEPEAAATAAQVSAMQQALDNIQQELKQRGSTNAIPLADVAVYQKALQGIVAASIGQYMQPILETVVRIHASVLHADQESESAIMNMLSPVFRAISDWTFGSSSSEEKIFNNFHM